MASHPSSTTRDRLLEAAVEVLRRDGAAGLTSRTIARSAGVNLQAITYHFGSKDALVAESLTALVQRRLEPIRAVLDSDGDPAERLFRALRTISETFAVARGDLAVYADALAAASANPALAGAVRDLRADLVGYLAGLTRELQADGYLESWVSPTTMATLLVAVGDGLAAQARDGEPDVDGVLEQMALLLLAARNPRKRVWPATARLLLRRLRGHA